MNVLMKTQSQKKRGTKVEFSNVLGGRLVNIKSDKTIVDLVDFEFWRFSEFGW